MSQFIKDFRLKNPVYDDMPDDQLVSALHNKYYSDIPIQQFNQKIGFQPIQASGLPSEQQQIEKQEVDGFTGASMKAPEEKTMLELVGDKLKNWGAGLGERAGDLSGALLETIHTAGEGIGEKYPMGGLVWEDGDIIPSYKSPEEWAKVDAEPTLMKGAEILKGVDLGYQEQANWEGVKKAFSEGGPMSGSAYAEVLDYGFEQGIKSVPDMVATVYALPAYIFARSGEIGEQRAKNKGKEKAELEDILEAAPFAAASALLERIGAKGMTSDAKAELGAELLKAGIKEQTKRVAKVGGRALSKEAATEAIQEGMIEYVGERYGTNAKMDFMEALDRAAAGAVAGGVFGGAVGTATGAANEINYSPEKALAKAMEEGIASKEFKTDEAAIDLLDPERAQLQKTKTEEKSNEVIEAAENTEVKPEDSSKIEVDIKEQPIDKARMPEQEEVEGNTHPEYEEKEEGFNDGEIQNKLSSNERVITHSGGEISKIESGVFGGIFGSYGEGSNAGLSDNYQTSFAVDEDKIAREGDIDLDYEKSIEWLKKEFPEKSKEDIDGLYEWVVEDKYDPWDNNLLQDDGFEDEGEASWEAQRLRGQIALSQGFDAVEMNDETGISILIPKGSKAKFVGRNYKSQEKLNKKQEVEEGSIKTRKHSPQEKKEVEHVRDGDSKPEAKFKLTTIIESDTPKKLKSQVRNDVKRKGKTVSELESLDKKELNKVAKTPTPSSPKEKTAEQVYEQQVYSNVAKSSVVIESQYNSKMEEQVETITEKQTRLDIDKAANNAVQEASMSRDGKITYPKPKEDVNTRIYKKLDNKIVKPPGKGERVFHAPGHNYIGLFRSTGIPERRSFVMIEGRKLNIPEEPQRIEPIISKLVKIMGRRIYFGKIKGKSSEGFYRPQVGEIRTRKKNDVEVLAHEMAHYLDFYSTAQDADTSGRFLPNFAKLYKQKKYRNEIVGLSYTTADRQIELIEGFAEFVRLWLTNSQEALIRAPKFYKAFTNLMARDRKLLNPMRDMQDLMHKFYFQGPDKLGQALIGKDLSFKQRFDEWAYRRDSRIRQQIIDRFHASRKVEQEISKKIGNVQESAWKQFRLANGGSEGISDYIMNYGTVNFDGEGDLQRTGKSLHEVLEPVKSINLKPEHKGDQKIDVLLRYFAGRRALELHRQGRENLIPKETAKEWARLGRDYPVFESIQKDYQAFNDRMMDFYEEAGMITPEGRKAMSKMNKDYVPFNRIREQLAGGPTGVGGGFQKLKGGTANLNDILVNIQDGITANVRSALTNRAKQRLYQYISNHKDGAIFATKIAPDSKPVQVYADEMTTKISKVLEANGIVIDGDIDLASKDLLTFWQHGVKPQLNESGNIVDSVIINGKPKYYEVQDPLLQEMLISMNPESYSSFMNVMFGVKNFFTRMITLGVEFTGANLVRDTTGAAFLSKNKFKPFVDSFKGMYSFITKDEHYQNFIKSGGGYSSRLEAMTKEGTARRRVKLDEFGVMTVPEKLLSTIDNIASAFEYGTRIGEFRLAKKNMKSDMDAAFEAREISTDFSVLGANRFLTGYIRTVPFLNAMIQSQDRVFREAVVRKKYDGNPTALAMKAFLGITVPTLILYLVNKDDEDYKAIPDYEKRTNWHIKIGDGQFVKIPRPYDVGFVYATMPELFAKYVEDDKGKEFADGMIWTLTQMYGIDGTPAMMTGWWDLVRNKKWTGAPVVPKSLSDVEAPEQYTSNTAETFVRMGEALGVSPVKAEHMFKAYTGYLGGYLLWGTDHMLWDEERFGEKPARKASDNIFLRRFLTPDVRPSTASMEKFFDLKEKSDRVVSTFKQQVDVRRAIKGQMKAEQQFKDDRFFGLSAKEKEVLFGLNDSMNQLIKLMYGKDGIKTAEIKVKHDKKLTGKQKREELDRLWNSRNDAFMKYYLQADKALQKAKQESENFKQEK